MQFDSDVAILGTGLAPLVAAVRLMHEGCRVLVLNPDWDFFSEGSELPLDPALLRADLFASSESEVVSFLERNQPTRILEAIRPDFPGAIELASTQTYGFHDLSAPHLRSRQLLWISEVHAAGAARFEEFFIGPSLPQKLQPQWLNPAVALSRFPGMNPKRAVELSERPDAEWRGLSIPRFGELDVDRYRYAVLEYLREKLGPERVLTGVSDLDRIPGGFRFHEKGQARTTRVKGGVLAFWSPRMTRWLSRLMGEREHRTLMQDVLHRSAYLEDWSLVSRESLETDVVGLFEDLMVWAEAPPAGVPDRRAPYSRALRVLRWAGDSASLTQSQEGFDDRSLSSISRLTREFLGWNRFSVHHWTKRLWTLPFVAGESGAPLERIRWSQDALPIAVCARSGGSVAEVVTFSHRAAQECWNKLKESDHG